MRRRRLPRILRTLLIVVVACELVLPAFLFFRRNDLLFLPSARPLPESALGSFGDVPASVVRVRRPDGRELAAYDVVPKEAGPDAPVVLYLHGNAGNIALRAGMARRFAVGARCRLLLLDYSGYGGNPGSPSEDEVGTDALAAYDHLVAGGVVPARIVVYGESLGGGPALLVASRRPVAGVVLQATFTSLSSMMGRVVPWLPLAALFVRGSFPNAERVARVTAPVLVVHGTRDATIPFAEGEALHAAAPPGTELLAIEGADHNDLLDVAGDAYLRGLGERLRQWTGH